MAECECLSGCLFFNDKMANRPSTAALMKKQYCLGNNQDCARFRVRSAIGGDKVPADLFPTQVDRVAGIVASVGK